MLHDTFCISFSLVSVLQYNNNNNTSNTNNNNNNNNITSMALKSSEARAQKRKKPKSVIIFKIRGHTGVIISFKGQPTI